MYVCNIVCPCIAFTFTTNLGGGNVNAYLIIFQPNIAHNLGFIGVIGFNLLLLCGGINQ